MWIDSHCHLNHERFDGADALSIAQDSLANNVDGMVTICCRISEELEQLTQIAEQDNRIWCTIGTHPHDASKPAEKEISLQTLIDKSQSSERIVGIGESGLDYYYTYSTPEDQDASFRKHIRACIETGLPLVVHARDADEDIARILKEEGAGTNLKGVMHCFSSGAQLAQEALELGFYISFSGIVTFKNATALQDIAKDIPDDRILVETDAPFLAPVPHRGKTNHPHYVHHSGSFLAQLRDTPVEDFAKLTTQNFFTLFDKAKL